VLTISGTGAMIDFILSPVASWYTLGNHIEAVIINNGVTSIKDTLLFYLLQKEIV
jgi:hypothetical protein